MCLAMLVITAWHLPSGTAYSFPTERGLFLRERRAGLYPTSAFYLARIIVDIPANVFSGILMGLIAYPMCNLRCEFHQFLLIIVSGILIGGAVLQTIGAMSHSVADATIYVSLVMIAFMLVGSGFVRETLVYLEWVRAISPVAILTDMAMFLEFQDVPSKLGSSDEIFDHCGVLVTDDEQFWAAAWSLLYIYLGASGLGFVFLKFLYTGRSFMEDLRG